MPISPSKGLLKENCVFTKFPAALYNGMSSQHKNLFMSPFSVQMALGMALVGSGGETRKQLAQAIDAETEEPNQLLAAYRNLIKESVPTNSSIELATANAIWVDGRYKVKPEYREIVRSFLCDVQQIDFQQTVASLDRINKWVSEKTKAKIENLINSDAINSETRLILTNAIYFKGKWNTPFLPADTKSKDFLVEGNQLIQTPMMNQTGRFGYFENDSYQALEMGYVGNVIRMLIILPKSKKTLLNPLHKWNSELYNNVLSNSIREEVIVNIPKFKITTPVMSFKKLLMGDLPEGLGATLAFSDNADFSGIGDEELKIDDVLHKAFVDVGEEGTEAAAATAVSMVRCSSGISFSEPKRFDADHPFVFVIRNCKTGTILFQCRVVDPR